MQLFVVYFCYQPFIVVVVASKSCVHSWENGVPHMTLSKFCLFCENKVSWLLFQSRQLLIRNVFSHRKATSKYCVNCFVRLVSRVSLLLVTHVCQNVKKSNQVTRSSSQIICTKKILQMLTRWLDIGSLNTI